MAAPLTAVEATEQLGLDRTAFAELIDNGVVARRAPGDAAFWPEELVLARLRHHPLVEPIPQAGPLLAFARILTQHPDVEPAVVAAVRLAICLTNAAAGTYHAIDGDDRTVLRHGEGSLAIDPPTRSVAQDTLAPYRIAGPQLTIAVREPAQRPYDGRQSLVTPLGRVRGFLTVRWPTATAAENTFATVLGPLTGLADLLGIALGRAADDLAHPDLVELDRLYDERMWDQSGRIAGASVAALAQRLTGTLAALVYRAAPGHTLTTDAATPLIRSATQGAAVHRWPSIALLQANDLAALLAGDTVLTTDLRTVRWPALPPDSPAGLAGAPIGSPDLPVTGFMLVFGALPGESGRHTVETLAALGRAVARSTRHAPDSHLSPTSNRAIERAATVNSVTAALHRANTLADGLRVLTYSAVTMSRAFASGIHLFHSTGTGIRVAARWCFEQRDNPDDPADPWTFYEFAPVDANTSGRQRTQTQESFQRAVAVPPGAQITALPLLLHGSVIGVFWLARRSVDPPFSLAELDAFSLLGRQGTSAIERGLLIDSERRQRHEATILLRLAAAVNRATTADELMDEVATIAGEAVGADRISVFLYDATQSETLDMARYCVENGKATRADVSLAADTLPPRQVPAEAEILRTRQPLLRDAQTPFPDLDPDDTWRSDIVVPLVAANSVQGVLYVRENTRPRLFGPEDTALLQAIGQHAGIAVLRVREAEAATRRAENLTALNALGRALSGTLDIDQLCVILRDHIQRMLPLDAFAVALSTGSPGDPMAVYADDDAELRDLFAGDSLPDHSPTTLVVPMVSNGIPIGLIAVRRGDRVAYPAEDGRTLETIAQLAAASFASARLFAESAAARDVAEGYAEDIQSVLNVTHAVASAPDLSTMLEVFADELGVLIPHHECIVFRLSPDGESLQATLYRRDGVPIQLDDPTLPASAGHCGRAIATGQPDLVNHAHLDPRSAYTDRQQETITSHGEHVMVAPLVVSGQSIGVIFLNRPGFDPPFSTAEFAIFRVLAEQAATAVRSATLVQEATLAQERSSRHAANLEAVLATARAITAQIELPKTLEALADHLQRLLPHDRLYVWLRNRNGAYFRPLIARIAGQPDPSAASIPATDGGVHRLTQAHQPMRLGLEGTDGQRLLMPLIVSGGPIGAVELIRHGPDGFSDEEVTVFQVLAGQAEVAIQASLLFTEERRRHRFTEVLVDAAAALNEAHTLDEVMRRATEAAADAVKVNRAALFLYDHTGENTEAWYTTHVEDEASFAEVAKLSARDIPVEREILETRRPITRERLANLLAQRSEMSLSGQRGGAAIPLRVGDRVQGVLYIWDKGPTDQPPREFDADEMSLLEAICDQAGIAAERARLHADTERRITQLRAIEGVTAAVTRTLDLRPMLRETLARVAEALAGELSVVALPEGDPPVLRVAECSGEREAEYIGLELPPDKSVNGRVFASGQAARGHEGDGNPFLPPGGRSSFIRYYLAVPLQIEGRTIGTLQVLRSSPGPFTANDEELLRLIASQLAVGVERARMFGIAVEARERSERQADQLETVLSSSRILALQTDLPTTLEAFCDGLHRLVPFEHAAVYRADDPGEHLVLIFQHVHGPLELTRERLPIGGGVSGEVTRFRRPVRIDHVEQHPNFQPTAWNTSPAFWDAVAAGVHTIILPLMVEGSLLGVVCISRVGEDSFSDGEFAIAQVFTGQAAASIRTMDLLGRNRDLYLGVVRSLAAMVDAKDPYTHGHSERVSKLARRIADALNLPVEEAETVELAALLHDIGKIGVPDRILQRPGPLDEADRITMMGHAAQGAQIVAQAGVGALQPLVPLIRHHHEWLNGNGYPDGLEGEEIPLGAAIIGVADAYDTLVTDRPYRRGRLVSEAIAELRRCTGSQFRADIVEALASMDDLDTGVEAGSPRMTAEPLPQSESSLVEYRPGAIPTDDTEPGRMGDSRPLAVLVDVAKITRHMPDLQTFLDRLPTIVQHRLGYEDVALYLVDQESGEVRLAAHAGAYRSFPDVRWRPGNHSIPAEVARSGKAIGTGVGGFGSATKDGLVEEAGSEFAVPLIVDDRTIGVLSVASGTESAFTLSDHRALSAIADQLSMAVHVAQLHAAAKHAAATDGLTGVSNHRAFYEALEDVTAIGDPFAVILFDVEGLKETNDSGGHLAGDALLRRVAHTIRSHVRETDLVARYGGDEFAVIMYGGDAEPARVAAAIRASLLKETNEHRAHGTTVRYGVAISPLDGTGPSDLVAIADARLYEMRASQPRTRERTSPDLLASD